MDDPKRGFFATTLRRVGLCHRFVNYDAYIIPAYAIAALLIGGLVVHSWLAARRAARALRNDR